MKMKNQTSEFNENVEEIQHVKGYKLHKALYNLLCEDNFCQVAKISLTKALCQIFGGSIDDPPPFIGNERDVKEFVLHFHTLYQFLNDIENANIEDDDLNRLTLRRELD